MFLACAFTSLTIPDRTTQTKLATCSIVGPTKGTREYCMAMPKCLHPVSVMIGTTDA